MIDEKQCSVLLWRFSEVPLTVPSSRKLTVSSSNVKRLAEPFRPIVECCANELLRTSPLCADDAALAALVGEVYSLLVE